MQSINLTQTGTTLYQKQAEQLTCPVCGVVVDYLLGDDSAGGRKGCELCWRPPVQAQQRGMPIPQPGESLPATPGIVATPEGGPVATPPIVTPNTPPPAPEPTPEPITPPKIIGTAAIPNPLGLDLNEVPANSENPEFNQLMGKLRSEVKSDAK